MKKKTILFIALAIVFASYSHEYILLASKFVVHKGEILKLHLFLLDGVKIEKDMPFQKKLIKKFELITQTNKVDILVEKKDSTFPFLNRNVDFEGLGLFYIERYTAAITLENKKFIEYLKEDNIENISINKSTKKEQKERYTRYIKCLVQSGKINNDTMHKTIVGHPFEIILLQNPYKLTIGKALQVQVIFQGKPLANKMLTIRSGVGKEFSNKIMSKTNADGIASFVINRKGDWFIHAIQMIPSPNQTEADWESFWAIYCFGIV